MERKLKNIINELGTKAADKRNKLLTLESQIKFMNERIQPLGYRIRSIDPARTKISLKKDMRSERAVKQKRGRKKTLETLIKDTGLTREEIRKLGFTYAELEDYRTNVVYKKRLTKQHFINRKIQSNLALKFKRLDELHAREEEKPLELRNEDKLADLWEKRQKAFKEYQKHTEDSFGYKPSRAYYKNEPIKQRTLFQEPRYQKYADIVDFKDPKSARSSVKKLNDEFNDAKTHEKRVRIIRVTNLASNRAKASSLRKNLSPDEKKEFEQIAKIYRKAQKDLSIKLEKKDSQLQIEYNQAKQKYKNLGEKLSKAKGKDRERIRKEYNQAKKDYEKKGELLRESN